MLYCLSVCQVNSLRAELASKASERESSVTSLQQQSQYWQDQVSQVSLNVPSDGYSSTGLDNSAGSVAANDSSSAY